MAQVVDAVHYNAPALLASNVSALFSAPPSSSEGERDFALGSIRLSVSFSSSSDAASFSTSAISSGLNNFQYAARCKGSNSKRSNEVE